MKNCSITACPGNYEEKYITHTLQLKNETILIDHVPAEVCDLCGDILFTPETVRHLEEIAKNHSNPIRTVPVYEYA
jgi:YgiT-type zinc finger domain-containing protein